MMEDRLITLIRYVLLVILVTEMLVKRLIEQVVRIPRIGYLH